MSSAYARHAFAPATQIERADPRQVINNAGGYTFTLPPLDHLRRFLVLGTEGGTYYASERKLTRDTAAGLVQLFNSADGVAGVELIEKVSTENLAPKVSPVLFALALAYASELMEVRRAAAKRLHTVCRTHSHLLEFVSYADSTRGWGRLLKESVSSWYNRLPAEKLAYQVAKYRNRAGWTTRDVLRMAKPVPIDADHSAIYGWATGHGIPGDTAGASLLAAVDACELYDTPRSRAVHVNYSGLTWEMVPTEWLAEPQVWSALLQNTPLIATVRNLGRLTANGTLTPLSMDVAKICVRLTDPEEITRSRIHPMQLLLALTTYRSGRGVKGSLSWEPIGELLTALEEAFYMSWKNVEHTGKRFMLALDVSGSMAATISNTHLSCREASVAMALVTANAEKRVHIAGFQSQLVPLPQITARTSLHTAVASISRLSFGSTDCSRPMLYALERGLDVDTFVVYTDSETYAGRIHPHVALRQYRERTGIDAKLIVVGMTATNFTIADPTDRGMLDVVGFDASAPQIISDFSAGRF